MNLIFINKTNCVSSTSRLNCRSIHTSLSNKKKVSRGFTLVEALVAISILMVAVTSPMMIAQKSLSTAILTKDQMTASFLAQDAIEAIKNIRDEIAINGLSTTDWITGDSDSSDLSKCICTDDNSCNFDNADGTANSNVIYCNIDTTDSSWFDGNSAIYGKTEPSSVNPLRIDSDSETGVFIKYDLDPSHKASKFSRKINIKKQGLVLGGVCVSGSKCNEAIINVRISWDSTLGVQNVDVKNFIYNISGKIPYK